LEERRLPSRLLLSAGELPASARPLIEVEQHAHPARASSHQVHGSTRARPDIFRFPVGYEPEQIRTAYGINDLHLGFQRADGAGQTIAIVDPYNDPRIFNDLNAFDKQFAITSTGSTLFKKYGPSSSFLTVLNQHGKKINPGVTTSPTTDPAGPGSPKSFEVEESLDVEWAHAIAPGARIDLIECSSASMSDLDSGVRTAASLTGVSVVSMSFFHLDSKGKAAEFFGENYFDGYFTTPHGHQPETFLAASGDSGSPGGYPAYSPNVVAVGGTSLNVAPNNSYGSETGWGGSGGGISTNEPEPEYQARVQETGNRTIPDVAFDANVNTGVAVYDSYDAPAQPWFIFGGTSLATPCWAGLIAIANQMRVAIGKPTLNGASETLPALYSLPAKDFHDITQGSNGGFTATNGYDEVTGLGSPVANRLVPALAAYRSSNHRA
jgi:subtilase family serine protease